MDDLLIVADAALQNRNLAFQLLPGAFQHTHLYTKALHLLTLLPQGCGQGFCVRIELFQFFMGLAQHKGGRNIVFCCLLGIRRKLVQLIQPNSHFHALQLVTIGQILLGLLGLYAQRL